MDEPKAQVIKPVQSCPHCRGEGQVYDSVPWGATTTLMPSFCTCVEEQCDEDTDEIVLDFDPLDNEEPPF